MSSVENEGACPEESARVEDRACAGYVVRRGAVAPGGGIVRRRRERRRDLRQVIRAVAAMLVSPPDERSTPEQTLPSVFEQALASVIPARCIRLREMPTRFQARLLTPARTSESVALDVPTADPHRQYVLEANFDPARPLDDWNIDLLSTAALLGTLVIDIDSRRGSALPVPRLDGAAPLIGSTPVMRSLRERVERVAGTDFMTLIEGAMRR